MSERLAPETVHALRRAEGRWLDQARDRLRDRAAGPAGEHPDRDEDGAR